MTIKKATDKIIELANNYDDGYWCKEILEFNKTIDYSIMQKANQKAIAILKRKRD